uniref:Uncharacterized protein n=1 Tax=Anguilla anguilla TaxID=7936 RepID=A0A0E9QUZ1_ANGAN
METLHENFLHWPFSTATEHSTIPFVLGYVQIKRLNEVQWRPECSQFHSPLNTRKKAFRTCSRSTDFTEFKVSLK